MSQDPSDDDVTLVNVAAIIGIIQGQFPANYLGSDATAEMELIDILGPSTADNLHNFIQYLLDGLGAEEVLKTLTTLMINNILVFDIDAFDHHVEIIPMQEDAEN